MRRIATMAGLAALTAAAACGGPGNVQGTVAGLKLTVQDAIFFDQPGSNGQIDSTTIMLVDQPSYCATVLAGHEPKNLTSLWLTLVNVGTNGSRQTPTTGSYTVTTTGASKPGKLVAVTFNHTDSSCKTTIGIYKGSGASGTVTASALTHGKSASGDFDVTVGDQKDHITGTFSATYCDLGAVTSQTCG